MKSSILLITAALLTLPLLHAETPVFRLPEVIVTASKEPEDAQTLPASVTTLTGSDLQQAGVVSVKEAAAYAPNVFINEFTARQLSNPFVRGIGGSPANPGVTTFIDGVPQLNSYSSNIDLLNVGQIEFLRGPQGALWGRNTLGGAINIVSEAPSFDFFHGSAETIFGNYDRAEARVMISGPIITNTAAFSAAFGYASRDGFPAARRDQGLAPQARA